MSKTTALILAVVMLVTVALISVVLAGEFHGENTAILISAIIGFTTPTVGTMLTLLAAVINGERTAQVSQQVAQTQNTLTAVNQKVNGHLARLTQIVVNAAATGEPVNKEDAANLAARTEHLTGIPIVNEKGGV